MTVQTATKVVNGFDTGALGGIAAALQGRQLGGKVTFVARSRWQDGARVFTELRGYDIDGTMHHQQERNFVVLGDEPREFGASDAAPAPVEMLLHALGNCIIATTNAYAALQGIEISSLEVVFDAGVDLNGMFGVDEDVRPGIERLNVWIGITGNASRAALERLVEQGLRYSPVRDTLAKGVTVEPRIEVHGAPRA